jgi:hypothetical protein
MDQGEGEKMSEKDFEETVLRRLANLESHIINMIHPLQQIQSIFRDSSVKVTGARCRELYLRGLRRFRKPAVYDLMMKSGCQELIQAFEKEVRPYI